ncbi:MFS-type transporter SLC18B1-like isoform X2 [Artemia franciscana]|uniref:Major facilitator superfamily (MFS) profile domain-containing protein n=1 Tax=Artemia franciscana TaxID=6661 RepID=A0AA88I580_ARTSF|nr:hypothetical protein QYM36_005761 [Artemia franciscana]
MWGIYTRRQWATILVVASARFSLAMAFSLRAPFYPFEAEKKGATATEYGLVFGVFYLIVFSISPLFGQYLNVIGAKFVFTTGSFVVALCTLLFGLLDLVNGHASFIGLSFAIRIIEAIGNAGYLTASYSYLAAEFPSTVATVFASLETFYGVGLIAGPALGAIFYHIGGFSLPFAVFGVIVGVEAIFSYFFLPSYEPTDVDTQNPFLVLQVLKVPGILLAACTIVVSAISTGFIATTLEPHLRQFNLSHAQIGSVFMIEGGTYAVFAPIWGRVCDRLDTPEIVTMAGSSFMLVGFIFLGPLPIIPIPTLLWLSCLSLVSIGIGSGALLVAGFLSGLKIALREGYPSNLVTFGVISGLWSSAFALGCFLGPSIAGYLYDHVGFRKVTWFCAGCHTVTIVTTLIYIVMYRLKCPTEPPDLFSEQSASTELTESTKLLGQTDSKLQQNRSV